MIDDEALLSTLADISFDVKKNTSILEDQLEVLKGVGFSMESVFIEKWEKLINKKDLKIISAPDPHMANQIESLQMALKRNSEALHSFKDDYIKQMSNTNQRISKMDLLLQGLFKEFPNSPRESASSEISNSNKVADDKKEKKSSLKIFAGYVQTAGLIALGYALSDIVSALPF